MRLLVNKIQRCCFHDGPGIRTTVFLQGCPLRCWWCHNPETQPFENPDAVPYAIPELVSVLERDARYWARSRGGITISGGEPLSQANEVESLLTVLGARDRHRAVETSGAGSRDDVVRIGRQTDLWLWDVKAVTPRKLHEAVGARADIVLGNLSSVLGNTDVPVVVRVPLIPDFNADEEELHLIAAWLGCHPRTPGVELLPGHSCGSGGPNLSLSAEELARARRIFEDEGLSVSRRPTGGFV